MNIEKLFDENNIVSYMGKYDYKGKILKRINKISYKELIVLIKNSIYYELFKEKIDNLDESLLYKSDIHGVSHNIRVAILITGISILENVSLEDYKILIYGALYHDIGRIDDNVDVYHGLRSAKLLRNIDLDLDSGDKRLLQLICMYHSINDEYIDLKKIKNIDIKRLKKLIRILKDADALDRIRVSALDVNYLRSYSSLSLVHASYELLANYEKLNNKRVLS